PTGAKFQCCVTRINAPSAIRPMANGLALLFCIDFSFHSNYLYYLSAGQPRRRLVRLPQSFSDPRDVAGPTAPDEQRVAQPVQIFYSLGWNAFHATRRHTGALRAPADGAAHVQLGVEPAAARQHE